MPVTATFVMGGVHPVQFKGTRNAFYVNDGYGVFAAAPDPCKVACLEQSSGPNPNTVVKSSDKFHLISGPVSPYPKVPTGGGSLSPTMPYCHRLYIYHFTK